MSTCWKFKYERHFCALPYQRSDAYVRRIICERLVTLWQLKYTRETCSSSLRGRVLQENLEDRRHHTVTTCPITFQDELTLRGADGVHLNVVSMTAFFNNIGRRFTRCPNSVSDKRRIHILRKKKGKRNDLESDVSRVHAQMKLKSEEIFGLFKVTSFIVITMNLGFNFMCRRMKHFLFH